MSLLTSAATAYVALGSNLGDSRAILHAAIHRLQMFSDSPVLRSSLWRTSPVDCPPGSPPFVNAVVGLVARADETPEGLLAKLEQVQREFGRETKRVMNEPRPLDLDLIAFGAETRTSANLTLPHPRAHLRRFVLQPLAEIAPELILPGQVQTIAELLRRLNSTERLERIAD